MKKWVAAPFSAGRASLIAVCLGVALLSACSLQIYPKITTAQLLAASRGGFLLLTGAFLFILPGWGILHALIPGWRHQPWEERIALSAGASLAAYPILFLWTDLVNLRLGIGYAWVLPVAGLLLAGWGYWRDQRSISHSQPDTQQDGYSSVENQLRNGVLFLVMAASLLIRIWVLRSVDMPLFGDGYQHTLIVQLLLDHGGLFDSWAPYAELTTFTYHFGFHSGSAAFSWLTGLPASQSVLWTGQIINFLAALAVLPLANRLGKNRWAGVFALLVAGTVTAMPFGYTNWGRYTQLAAQVMLPAAAWLIWELSSAPSVGRGFLAATTLLIAGLALTHYRVLFFILALLPLAIWLGDDRKTFRRNLASYAFIGLGAGAIFLPWFIHVYTGKILEIFSYQVTTSPVQAGTVAAQTNSLGNLFDYLPAFLWVFLPLAAGWGLWKKEKGAALVAGWWFLVFLLANPQWFNLSGEGALSSFAVLLAAYIPASVLIGAASAWMLVALQPRLNYRFWLHAVSGVIILAIAAWAAPRQVDLIQPQTYALVTRSDLKAADWIRENTPPTARFLVNTFPAFGGYSVAGSDAGWWLPLIANRATTLPPLNYSFEQGARPDYRVWVNALVDTVLAKGLDDPEVLAMLSARGVTHVYVGQREGRVNYNGPAFIDPELLLQSEHYRPVYHQDRVWIFEMIQP